jgi:transposase
MRRANYPIQLSDRDQRELETIVRSGQRQARLLRRAQILLWSDAGKRDSEIAQFLEVTPYTVAQTRERWGTERRLEDRPRCGRQPKTDGKQDAFLVALACSDAPDGQEPWTMQLLADRLVELGVVETPISDETVRRRLKKLTSNPG